MFSEKSNNLVFLQHVDLLCYLNRYCFWLYACKVMKVQKKMDRMSWIRMMLYLFVSITISIVLKPTNIVICATEILELPAYILLR